LAARVWARQYLNPTEKTPITETFDSYAELTAHVKPFLEKAKIRAGRSPSVMVIGALGKSGRGATEIAERWGYT